MAHFYDNLLIVRSQLSVHKLMGRADPTKLFLIQKLLTADVRLLITRPVLHELRSSLRQANSSVDYK